MAAKTYASANDYVNWALRKVDPSWAGATTLYWSLHSAAVPLGGDQTSNEIAYTGYARVAFIRDPTTGLFVASALGVTSNNALVQFGIATGGSFPLTALAASIGPASSGAGTAILTGLLASPLIINLNVRPEIDPGAATYAEQ